jgi:hypothetical protein
MATTQQKLMKLAPTMVVLGLSGYGVWSNQDSSRAGDKAETLPTVTPTQLRPPMPPSPEHNPFVLKGHAAPPVVVSHSAPKVDLIAMVHSMTLNATYISDGKATAIISGHVYGLGDAVARAAGNKDLVITKILADRVQLTQGDLNVELAFSDHSPAPEHMVSKGDHHNSDSSAEQYVKKRDKSPQ